MNKEQFLQALKQLEPLVTNINDCPDGLYFSIFSDSGYEFKIRLYDEKSCGSQNQLDYIGELWDFTHYQFDADTEIDAFRENSTYREQFTIRETLKDFDDLHAKLLVILERLEAMEKEPTK
ncbi:MAG: hypothetical protein LBM95_03840 [Lactobacillales bacterium]|jgi:hypothetical protein|nr:hypothetical protein [Lactobacillales bacterium]